MSSKLSEMLLIMFNIPKPVQIGIHLPTTSRIAMHFAFLSCTTFPPSILIFPSYATRMDGLYHKHSASLEAVSLCPFASRCILPFSGRRGS